MPSTFCARTSWVTPSIEVYDSLSFRLAMSSMSNRRHRDSHSRTPARCRRAPCRMLRSGIRRFVPRTPALPSTGLRRRTPPAEFAVETLSLAGRDLTHFLPGSDIGVGQQLPPESSHGYGLARQPRDQIHRQTEQRTET